MVKSISHMWSKAKRTANESLAYVWLKSKNRVKTFSLIPETSSEYKKAKKVYITARVSDVYDEISHKISMVSLPLISLGLAYNGVMQTVNGTYGDKNVLIYTLTLGAIYGLTGAVREVLNHIKVQRFKRDGLPIKFETEAMSHLSGDLLKITTEIIKIGESKGYNVEVRDPEWEGNVDIVISKPGKTPVRFPLSIGYINEELSVILPTVQGEKMKEGEEWDKSIPKEGIKMISEALNNLGYSFYMINPQYNVWAKKEKKKRGHVLLPEIMYSKFFKKDEMYIAFPKYSKDLSSYDEVLYKNNAYTPTFPFISTVLYPNVVIAKVGRFRKNGKKNH